MKYSLRIGAAITVLLLALGASGDVRIIPSPGMSQASADARYCRVSNACTVTSLTVFGTRSQTLSATATGLKVTDVTGAFGLIWDLSGLSADHTAVWPNADGTVTLGGNTFTGTGSVARAISPAFTTPNLGTPSAVVLTNGTLLPISTGVSGLAAGIATFLGTATSANLASAITDETGTGFAVFNNSPAFVNQVFFPAGSSAAPGQTFTGDTAIWVYNIAASHIYAIHTGTDADLFIRANPAGTVNLEAANDSAGADVPLNIVGSTVAIKGGLVAIASGKTFTLSNSITFVAGADGITETMPSTSFTTARTDAGNTFTGHQTIEGVTSTGATGTGKFMFDTSPTVTTSIISPLFRSTVAKVLLQGTGTGATQLAMTQTTAPTCSSNCGTSPSVAGTDSAGIVTMGGTGSPASAWVVTFNGTWASAPACVVQSALASMVVGKMPIAVVTTTTTMTVTTNGTAPATSDKYQFICIGTQ